MIYKNIEVFNVGELIPCEDGAVTWLRVPKNVDAVLSEGGKKLNRGSTGVELRLVLKSPTATIRIQSLSAPEILTTYQVYYGGIQGGWECHELNTYIGNEPFDIVLKKSANFEKLERMTEVSGLDWSPEVVRIIFNRGTYKLLDVIGDVEPPTASQTPKKTLLCYGSSITHGSNSYVAPNNWTALVAHNINYDLRNLGFAGNCRMEPEMVDYIAAEGENGRWDMAVLELGINVLGWEDDLIFEHVTNTLEQIAGRNPDKKIFVVSPFYCHNDFDGKPHADNWRRIIAEICERLAYPNVVYTSGTDILPDMTYISGDEVHPNIYGVELIAKRLTDIIKKHM